MLPHGLAHFVCRSRYVLTGSERSPSMGTSSSTLSRLACLIGGAVLVVACAGQPQQVAQSVETAERVKVAAANMADAVVVDCQLPGSLRKLGGTRTYLTPGKLVRLPAV